MASPANERYIPQRGEPFVSRVGRIAHVSAGAWTGQGGTVQAIKSLCGGIYRVRCRPSTPSDPRCRRCLQRSVDRG